MNCIPEHIGLTVENIGGKAFNLERLCAMGENVPEWLVLSSELFFELLGDNTAQYRRLLTSYSEESRLAILELIRCGEFSAHTKQLITDKLTSLFGEGAMLSVRSSATDEDGERCSFAGMMDSFLNVSGAEEVLQSVKKCYLSCFSQRIMEYRTKN